MNNPFPLDTPNRLPAMGAHDPRVMAFATTVLEQLPYDPNEEQMLFVAAFAHFLLYAPERSVMLLSGYAGTGKTSLTGAIVKAMSLHGMACVLLAPTGRAAHIFGDYAGHPAYTIHRKIYRQQGYGVERFSLADNKHTSTVFLVDEASMIANSSPEGSVFGSGHLLDDLIDYVYNGQGCRLLLMGDVAQLPPVGQLQSPALSDAVLQARGLTVYEMRLREVARQQQHSGILHNATLLRSIMETPVLTTPHLELDNFADIEAISSEYVMEKISDCYDHGDTTGAIVVTRSNRRASLFNGGIRARILYREELLSGGDLLLVAKNNYFWAADYDQLDFIANGDVCRVRRVRGEVEWRYGLQFATVTVEFPDHDGVEMDVKIVLDCLQSDTPALTREQSERLFNEVWAELAGDKRERYRALKQHPYFNALQVKFAYAVTCHKAQGGQWDHVFIDMGGIAVEATQTLDYYRWLYTALTRARKHVYLINYELGMMNEE